MIQFLPTILMFMLTYYNIYVSILWAFWVKDWYYELVSHPNAYRKRSKISYCPHKIWNWQEISAAIEFFVPAQITRMARNLMEWILLNFSDFCAGAKLNDILFQLLYLVGSDNFVSKYALHFFMCVSNNIIAVIP